MDDQGEPTAKVLFQVPNEDGSFETETLWAYELGGDFYKLANCPFYAYGVSWEDIVYAPPDPTDGFPTFERVHEKSGNRTIRITIPDNGETPEESDEVVKGLLALGCSYEGATRTYLSINIPPAVDLRAVVKFLVSESATWEHADPTYDEFHANRH